MLFCPALGPHPRALAQAPSAATVMVAAAIALAIGCGAPRRWRALPS